MESCRSVLTTLEVFRSVWRCKTLLSCDIMHVLHVYDLHSFSCQLFVFVFGQILQWTIRYSVEYWKTHIRYSPTGNNTNDCAELMYCDCCSSSFANRWSFSVFLMVSELSEVFYIYFMSLCSSGQWTLSSSVLCITVLCCIQCLWVCICFLVWCQHNASQYVYVYSILPFSYVIVNEWKKWHWYKWQWHVNIFRNMMISIVNMQFYCCCLCCSWWWNIEGFCHACVTTSFVHTHLPFYLTADYWQSWLD